MQKLISLVLLVALVTITSAFYYPMVMPIFTGYGRYSKYGYGGIGYGYGRLGFGGIGIGRYGYGMGRMGYGYGGYGFGLGLMRYY